MKKYLAQIYTNARLMNDELVSETLRRFGPFESLLDVGCWDGVLTLNYAKAAGAKKIYGIEVVKEKSDEAEKRGIKCFSLKADQDIWPFKDGSLDCVVSNQVIEHLSDVDHFLGEASRVLRKGGVLVTSTNNLASWHNIFALFFGWAPFDLTNSSKVTLGIGNPVAVHRAEKTEISSWTHKCIYTPRWLFEWQEQFGLSKLNHFGSGFYPLPASVGNIFKNHAAFMIIATIKK
ncbi:MAG: class I SAM-dependent methyltransferase [bacterium]|nr:class I SAM-dependent methyltransferase [bacterium]